MARAAIPGRLTWRLASVSGVKDETPEVRSLSLDVPGWPGHRAGQHVDVRLTADDGYVAERSYSIATAPDGTGVGLTIERLDDGEVSPYLAGELRPGDQLELRGPIGGFFVWEPTQGGPLFLAGGGSGMVPLMAMIRTRQLVGSSAPVKFLVSSRSFEDIIYRSELEALAADGSDIEVIHTLTRRQPAGWTGYARRVDRELVNEVAWPIADRPLCYICGPNGFVESVASNLVALGHSADRIRTERFGPSGGPV